jgi:ribonucleoside-diphosphate reductase alpha chain
VIEDPGAKKLASDSTRAPETEQSADATGGETFVAIQASSEKGALESQLEEMMGDAPVCDGCGHITVRNGACYKCLNCGNSMGCS